MFVTALRGTRHLRVLDLSRNLIGQRETVVRTQKGYQTATRAIAEHLSSEECCLRILKVPTLVMGRLSACLSPLAS